MEKKEKKGRWLAQSDGPSNVGKNERNGKKGKKGPSPQTEKRSHHPPKKNFFMGMEVWTLPSRSGDLPQRPPKNFYYGVGRSLPHNLVSPMPLTGPAPNPEKKLFFWGWVPACPSNPKRKVFFGWSKNFFYGWSKIPFPQKQGAQNFKCNWINLNRECRNPKNRGRRIQNAIGWIWIGSVEILKTGNA